GCQVRARVGDEQVLSPRAIDGVPKAPPTKRAVALRVRRIQAVETLSARRDGANHHALADGIFVLEPVTQRVDDPDGLVAEDETRLHRVLSLDDMHVGAADGCSGNANHGLASSWNRFLPFLDLDNSRSAEHRSFHELHDVLDF